MSDPLANMVNDEESAYGISPTRSTLIRLYDISTPELFLQATENMLERIVLLEMYLEEERNLQIGSEELQTFRAKHLPEIQNEMKKLASIFYGSVARREGG